VTQCFEPKQDFYVAEVSCHILNNPLAAQHFVYHP